MALDDIHSQFDAKYQWEHGGGRERLHRNMSKRNASALNGSNAHEENYLFNFVSLFTLMQIVIPFRTT